MKLIHLSDLHLGKRVNGFSMLEDQAFILRRILQVIGDEQPDAVLIAGDTLNPLSSFKGGFSVLLSFPPASSGCPFVLKNFSLSYAGSSMLAAMARPEYDTLTSLSSICLNAPSPSAS